MGALVMDIGRICVVYISVEYLVLAIVFQDIGCYVGYAQCLSFLEGIQLCADDIGVDITPMWGITGFDIVEVGRNDAVAKFGR